MAVQAPVNHQLITYAPESNSNQTNWLTKQDWVKLFSSFIVGALWGEMFVHIAPGKIIQQLHL